MLDWRPWLCFGSAWAYPIPSEPSSDVSCATNIRPIGRLPGRDADVGVRPALAHQPGLGVTVTLGVADLVPDDRNTTSETTSRRRPGPA